MTDDTSTCWADGNYYRVTELRWLTNYDLDELRRPEFKAIRPSDQRALKTARLPRSEMLSNWTPPYREPPIPLCSDLPRNHGVDTCWIKPPSDYKAAPSSVRR